MNKPTNLAEVTETLTAQQTEADPATGVRRTAQPAALRGAPSRSGEELVAAPPVPETLEDTGLSSASLSDLLLRTLNQQGARTGAQLEAFIRLPFHILDDELLTLQQRRFVEVRSTQGVGRRGYVFDLTGEGRTRVREILHSARYVGPAPVPLDQYWAVVDRQKVQDVHITRSMVREGFEHMVMSQELIDSLGPAVNSGKSLFLYGFAGNGKTTIAEAIAGMMGGAIYVPFSIEVEGQVISIFDPLHHRPVFDDDPVDGNGWLRPAKGHDPRFIRVHRPVVMVGGELTLDQLELQYDAQSGVFRAPPQVKSNGGVFIIDDFGRQRVRPRDLLNRWMVPLEKHVDFLTLPTGPKLPMPFECLLIFSTNLDPSELVEEAFLRRIRYKIMIGDPNREQYEEIFQRCCAARGIEYEKAAVDFIFENFYEPHGIFPRACHPRDLVNQVCDVAQYLEVEASLALPMLKLACGAYFLDTSDPQNASEETVNVD
ncbi:MAG: ATP-binding protein [Gemmatimonadota bacterium]|jgi:energy-coupling factor transporter ATP-binding protein EcfA2|nr:MAG: ATP-binding protein [Gemmatimonadota bacterium]